MTRKKDLPLAFGFTSEYMRGHINPGKSLCLFCDVDFPTPPIVVEMSELRGDGAVGMTAHGICPSCILSDTKTLTAKLRATTEKHQQKTERLRKEHGPGAEDLEDYELEEDWCDNSDCLNDFADRLKRLGDVSKIINYDLAVLIAKHYTERRKGKAA
jgi:hypothetical protein